MADALLARLEPRLAKIEKALLTFDAKQRRIERASREIRGANCRTTLPTDPATGQVLGEHSSPNGVPEDGGHDQMERDDFQDEAWNDVLDSDEQIGAMLKDIRLTATAQAMPTMRRLSTRTARSSTSNGADKSWNTSSGRFLVRHLSERTLTLERERVKQRLEAEREGLTRFCIVLLPEGRTRKLWNLLIVLLICFCAVAVPLEMGYERGMREALGSDGWGAWISFNLFVDLSFILDIALNFRTGFFVEGEVVTDSYRIARHYIRGTFVLDALGAFPINLILEISSSSSDEGSQGTSRLNRQLRLLRFFKLNRLLRLSKLSGYLKYLELETEFNPSVLRVGKLIILMVACCHWMGSTWWVVSEFELAAISPGAQLEIELSQHNEWHPSQTLLHAPLGAQVASGFFWGAGIVTNMVRACTSAGMGEARWQIDGARGGQLSPRPPSTLRLISGRDPHFLSPPPHDPMTPCPPSPTDPQGHRGVD